MIEQLHLSGVINLISETHNGSGRSANLTHRAGNSLVTWTEFVRVDCHMPLQPSQILVATANGRQLRPEVRTHWIKVYRDLPATNSASTSTSVSSPLAHYRR